MKNMFSVAAALTIINYGSAQNSWFFRSSYDSHPIASKRNSGIAKARRAAKKRRRAA